MTMPQHACFCGRMTDYWRNYCDDCYLRKEAGYGLWDLTHDDPNVSSETKDLLRTMAIERLINFTRHQLEKGKI